MLVSSPPRDQTHRAHSQGHFSPLASPSTSLSHLSLATSSAPTAAAERPHQGLMRRSSSASVGTGGGSSAPRPAAKAVKGKGREGEGHAAPPEASVRIEQDEDASVEQPPPLPSSNKLKPAEEDPEDARLDEEGQPRFVGNPAIRRDRDEPILRETQDRFVLFPIQYQEVRLGGSLMMRSVWPPQTLTVRVRADLGTLQARAGVILDRRGDGASSLSLTFLLGATAHPPSPASRTFQRTFGTGTAA